MPVSRLKEYKDKRNFKRTREPSGKAPAEKDKNFFVVQKHDATRLHYDFRLAVNGVLKSWAVPKGFPTAKGDRRLAVQVEDHPMDYARFEGIIPEGNYGAGTVMVWDLGSYEVGGGDPARALDQGKLHLVLHGEKLKGEWTLVRMRRREGEVKPQWLLLKSGQASRPIPARAEDQSVLTKRSLKQIASDRAAQWQSNRAAQPPRSPAKRRVPVPGASEEKAHASRAPEIRRLPKRRAAFVEPMKAVLSERLPQGDDWVYEIKFDGVRGLAVKEKTRVSLISRNQKILTPKYPEIADALKGVSARDLVLDGEIVALDSDGKPSFQLLQAAALPGVAPPPLFYYVFDAVQMDGKDLTGLPLTERKAIVQSLVESVQDPIRFSGSIRADSEIVLKEMKARGLEGLIAKRRDSKYEIGRRSGAWVKFKWTNEQEFVIGGYTSPQGTRSHFGAVLVGYHEGRKLLFASKVGTGFDQRLLESLHRKFQSLRRTDCPFANLPEPKGSRWGPGLTVAEMRRCTWIEPELVCQIRFAEWTRDGHLRQPAFLGLREDKKPTDVVRENRA